MAQTAEIEERAELAREAEWQAVEEEYDEWVSDGARGLRESDHNPREDVSLTEWLSNKASWNRPNKYERAMDWNERGLG